MLKSIPILKIVSIGFIMSLIFLIPSCDQLLQPESAELVDADNDGFDDRDILFLQKLIDNSSADSTTTWEDVGGQIWTDGRLRSLYHQGGKPYGDGDGFYLYEIPGEIEGAQYLNKLKLYKNYLTVIPDEIEYLDRLTEINLENNISNKGTKAVNGHLISDPSNICPTHENHSEISLPLSSGDVQLNGQNVEAEYHHPTSCDNKLFSNDRISELCSGEELISTKNNISSKKININQTYF